MDLNASRKRAERRARQIGRDAAAQVEAYIGATPYRPESEKMLTMSSRPSYYESDEWAEYDDFIHDCAAKHGVTLVREEYADGLWLGEAEPAGAYVARANSVRDLHAWAGEVAGRYDQDSVMVSQITENGDGRLVTYGAGGTETGDALQVLKSAGIPGGRVVDGRLQIVSTPDAPIPGKAHALLSARYGHEGTDTVRTAFVTKTEAATKHAPIKDIQRIRQLHAESKGLPAPSPVPHLTDSDDIAAAKFYQEAPHEPDNPVVVRSYRSLRANVKDQYNALVAEGYQFHPWDETAQRQRQEERIAAARRRAVKEGKNPNRVEAALRRQPPAEQPYASSAEMLEDLRANKRLYYYRTAVSNANDSGGALSDGHPMEQLITVSARVPDEQIPRFKSGARAGQRRDGKPEGTPVLTSRRIPANDAFRAVHDAFGHTNGHQFGPSGEKRAWWTHRNSLPSRARIALWNETRAQNCWTNAGPHMQTRDPDGKLRLKQPAEDGWIPLSQRPYGPQKCVNAPNWLV